MTAKPRTYIEYSYAKGDDRDDGVIFRFNELSIVMQWVARCLKCTYFEDKSSCAIMYEGTEIPKGDDPQLLRKKAYGYVDTLGIKSPAQRVAAVEDLLRRTEANDLHPGADMILNVVDDKVLNDKFSQRKWVF